jgi:site-specific recombinase XerD
MLDGMKKILHSNLPALPQERRLTAAQFQALADVPPEAEWFANFGSTQTRRAYQNDLKSFMTFAGIEQPGEFRQVTRAHVIAWRRELERNRLAPSSIRRKLAALASLFEHLCESNAVTHNPVDGVKCPAVETYEGKTPIIGNYEAAGLLVQPDAGTLKGLRDRALLSVMLFQGLRREEVAPARQGCAPERRLSAARSARQGQQNPLFAG